MVGVAPSPTNDATLAPTVAPAGSEPIPRSDSDPATATGPVYDALLQYVKAAFLRAEQARQMSGVEKRMTEDKLRRAGMYTADQAAKIEAQGQQPVFIRHTTTKCNHAEAVLEEIETTVSSRSWSIEPSAEPDTPRELRDLAFNEAMQEYQTALANGQIEPLDPVAIRRAVEKVQMDAENETLKLVKGRCDRAERKLRALLEAINFEDVYADVRSDAVTLGTGILKAPVMRSVPRLSYADDDSTADVVTDNIPVAEHVDPLDFYPEASSIEPDDGYVVEKYRGGRKALHDLIECDGYIGDNIRSILKTASENTVPSMADSDRQKAEDKHWGEAIRYQFDIFEFWGHVNGKLLQQAGADVDDESGEYAYQVIWCADKIIKVVPNPNQLGRNPYHVCRYKRRPGSFWGDGVPELMRDKQDFINAAGRAMAVNCGLIGGPQVEIDKNRFAEGQGTGLFPLKKWITRNPGQLTTPAIRFTDIKSTVADLMAVMDRFEQGSDDATGVQPFTYGSDNVAGAGRTFSGMAQLTQLALRGVKQTIRSLDRMKSSFIRDLYHWFVQYTDDQDFKGDCRVKASGTLGIMLSDLRMARLNDVITMAANPVVMQIIGVAGMAKVVREYIELLIPDGTDIVPSDTNVLAEIERHGREIEAMARARGEAPQQQGAGQVSVGASGRTMPYQAQIGQQVSQGIG